MFEINYCNWVRCENVLCVLHTADAWHSSCSSPLLACCVAVSPRVKVPVGAVVNYLSTVISVVKQASISLWVCVRSLSIQSSKLESSNRTTSCTTKWAVRLSINLNYFKDKCMFNLETLNVNKQPHGLPLKSTISFCQCGLQSCLLC